MKSEISRRLDSIIHNSLQIVGESSVNANDGFSEIEFRALNLPSQEKSPWCVEVTNFNELTLFSFAFDDSAGDWNNFYFRELVSTFSTWESAVIEQISKGFEVDFHSNGAIIPLNEISANNKIGRISIKAKLRLKQIPERDNFEEYLCAIRDFTGLCILPLIPKSEFGETFSNELELGLPEGAQTSVIVNKYERSPKNRAACLAHYGYKCYICNFDFGSFYGKFADSYIHVHHIIPVSEIGSDYLINPISDLIPLCPNCHAAIHISNPAKTPDELKEIIVNLRNLS